MYNFHKKSFFQDIVISVGLAALLIAVFHFTGLDMNFKKEKSELTESVEKNEPKLKYGFNMQDYHFDQIPIGVNQFLSDILQYEGISFQTVTKVEKNSKDVFNIRKFKAGKILTLIKKDECGVPCSFVYEPDPFHFVVYDLEDKCEVKQYEKEYEVCVEYASGQIETSLWDAMINSELSPAIIDLMEDAIGSQVDFHHAKIGDEFKLIYEQKYIENKPVAYGKILGAYFKNSYGDHYSVRYKNDKYDGYYDQEGRPAKRAFLRAPVRYSRISSRYNLRRFHPIKKRTIPHLGTDYAAAHGTPILSVGDGVVTNVSYTRGNGKFVKIKHNKTYQTQYLHMSRFAKGIKRGTRVKQGQVIGYVGQTGLATGPHVCFRFWKNGRQIDPLRENFPPPNPMSEEDLPEFHKIRDFYLGELDAMESPRSPNSRLAQIDEKKSESNL